MIKELRTLGLTCDLCGAYEVVTAESRLTPEGFQEHIDLSPGWHWMGVLLACPKHVPQEHCETRKDF